MDTNKKKEQEKQLNEEELKEVTGGVKPIMVGRRRPR